jgi:hypothetical protein
MKKKDTALYEQIDEILWNDWDPIGLNDQEEIRDEYQSYTPHLFKLKTRGAGKVKISEHLYRIETIDIGLEGNKARCEEVAQKIADIPY